MVCVVGGGKVEGERLDELESAPERATEQAPFTYVICLGIREHILAPLVTIFRKYSLF